jgi:RNA polymerase sigma factor (sigma-70 family)
MSLDDGKRESQGKPEHTADPETTLLGAPAPREFTRTKADLDRLRRGDARAFDDIWRRYAPALEMVIETRIRPRLEPELQARIVADDILQVAARKVQEKLPGFEYRGPGSVLAWMTAIVQHVVTDMVDYWRASVRDPRRERALEPRDGDTDSRHVVVPDTGTGPATRASRSEQRRAVAAAVNQLSERHQTIVILRFFAGATWEDIAGDLGEQVGGDAIRMEFSTKVLPLLATLLPSPR